MWGERDHQRQMEVEIPTSTLLSFAERSIEVSEQLQNALLASAMACRGVLDREWMNASIMAPNLESAMADANRANKINIWQEALNANEVLVLVFVLQILPWYLNLIKFLEAEFAEVDAVTLQIAICSTPVKSFLEFVAPSS